MRINTGCFAYLALILMVTCPVATYAEDSDLYAMSFEELMNVEVTTASKSAESQIDAPGVVSVVTAHEIEGFGARNLEEVLSRVTSLYLLGSFLYPNNVVSMRGDLRDHSDNHVLVLINGRPYRDTTQGGINAALYRAFPVDVIHHVEVVRGPGSVLYGSNAFAGVINVITNKADEMDKKVSVGAGSHETVDGSLSMGATDAIGDLNVVFSVNYEDTDGWLFKATDERRVSDTTHVGQKNVGAFMSLNYGNLNLDLFAAQIDHEHFGIIPAWPFGTREEDRLFADLGYDWAVNDWWNVEFNFTYNNSESLFTFEPLPPPVLARFGATNIVDTDSEGILYEVTNKMKLSDRFNLLLGGVADNRTGSGVTNTGAPLVGIVDYDEMWYSAYLQGDYALTNWLKFTAGVQYNKPEDIDSDMVPMAAANITFSDQVGMKLIYGEAYRAPFALEQRVNAQGGVLLGNPNLEPETIKTMEAELHYTGKSFQGSIAYFDSTEEDLVGRIPTAGGTSFTFANTGELDIHGLELEIKSQLTPSLLFIGGYTYQENEDSNGVDDFTLIPNSMLKTGLLYDTGSGMKFGLWNNYMSDPGDIRKRNPAVALVNEDADAYSDLSANVNIKLRQLFGSNIPNFYLNLHATNLLDEDIQFPEFVRRNINSLPIAGSRAYYGELTLKF